MLKLTSLSSGSSGNCSLLETEDTKILIDFGISTRKVQSFLKYLGYDLTDISGILLTHDHSDHTQGLKTFLKHYKTNIFSTKKLLDYIKKNFDATDDVLVEIKKNTLFDINDISVRAFQTSHDAIDSMGFRFSHNDEVIGYATDLGEVTADVRNGLIGCERVFLEANYDDEMILYGPYPHSLKQRIRSAKGHLSNLQSAEFICELIENGTKTICLGHLSKENNNASICMATVNAKIKKWSENSDIDTNSIKIISAPRDDISESI